MVKKISPSIIGSHFNWWTNLSYFQQFLLLSFLGIVSPLRFIIWVTMFYQISLRIFFQYWAKRWYYQCISQHEKVWMRKALFFLHENLRTYSDNIYEENNVGPVFRFRKLLQQNQKMILINLSASSWGSLGNSSSNIYKIIDKKLRTGWKKVGFNGFFFFFS